MERFRRSWEEESTDERYNLAYKKVKRIKGFYSHLKAYVVVNLVIIISSLNRNFISSDFEKSDLFEWHTYSTAFFWGIGIVIHWITVFGRDWFFSNEWEERKINEFMEKEKNEKSD